MSNVAGKAYAMNVLTPIRPSRTWFARLIFMFTRARPDTLAGLLGLSFIHFARWILIRRDQWPDFGQPKERIENDYMLFVSNFNGTWDQYIDAFSDGLPGGLDLLWYTSVKYPHSIPITPFKAYIRANQIDTDYYYNATPGAAQKDIKAAMRLRRALIDLGKQHAGLTPEQFAAAYRQMLVARQNDLRGQGEAPVASTDTACADVNRLPYVRARWGSRADA
ncbi:MAG: hypothetical protein JOZ90_15620 [Alphaproteobacteria bacterium]|nr:hypothetical protein [Alphaproteobacteria bacterium]MBV9371727.1 hypothetical protein [Alphaproteobacteria bacterium]MBV9902503.1 hypothetical protein [Alphaproteobacteria bacterium]